MKKNDFLELAVTAADKNGNGIARAENGMTVFVKNACAGDTVNAKIIKVTKNYAVAIIDKIIQPSADRFAGGCPVSGKCGGCVFQHINYDAECRFKAESINSAFERIGKIGLRLSEFHPAESTCSYRNKAVYPIGKDRDGRTVSGFYAQMSHRIIPHGGCYIGADEFSEIKDFAVEYIEKNKISVYDESLKSGVLKSLYLRRADKDGSIVLTFIINGNVMESPETETAFVQSIVKAFPQIHSVLVNVNRRHTNAVLGNEWRTLYDELCGRKFRISPASFYQVNHAQTEVLYGIAKKYAGLKPGEKLLDLYCGTGTVGICTVGSESRLLGVEIVPQAVKDADFNGKANGLNAEFICLDAEHALDAPELTEFAPDVITVDPPRKGCGIEAARKIAQLGANRIVYISCDPATLARDLAEFESCGYTAVSAEGVDMFPRTGHVETVVCLTQK